MSAVKGPGAAAFDQAAVADGIDERSLSRSMVSWLLVVLATFAFLAASVGYWADQNLLTTDVWVDRVAPLSSDPAVQAALTDVLTDQLMAVLGPAEVIGGVAPAGLVPGLTAEFRSILEGYVADALASPGFSQIWEEANRQAHASMVRLLREEEGVLLGPGEEEGVVLLNLMPVIDLALHRMATETPLLVDGAIISLLTGHDDPEEARAAIEVRLGRRLEDRFGAVEIFDDDRLAFAQRGVTAFDRAFEVSVFLTVVLVAAALLVSRRRRRTGIGLLFGALVVTAVVRLGVVAFAGAVLGQVDKEIRHEALDSVIDAFLDPYLATTNWMLLGGAVGIAVLVAVDVASRRRGSVAR